MTETSRWPLDKVLDLLAGSVVLGSLAMGRRRAPRWRLLAGFVGSNLLLRGAVGWCPSSLMLHRLGLRSRCELLAASSQVLTDAQQKESTECVAQ